MKRHQCRGLRDLDARAARSLPPSGLPLAASSRPSAVPGSGPPRTHRTRAQVSGPFTLDPVWRRPRIPVCGALAIVFLPLALSSCAYYNTFYLARKYYDRATGGMPYVVDKAEPQAALNFGRSIDYSKKVIGNYPKSKWVDDAYLLWARALMGREDPTQTVNMLKDFPARYPQSPLKDEALFYLGAGARKSRQYSEARAALEEFLHRQPTHPLAAYAYLEQARVYMALQRPAEAAAAATQMIERFPRNRERDRALEMRAEALLAKGDHALARADYKELGTRALSDEGRFNLLLKEADCLEAGRLFDEELSLLREAMVHEQEPLRQIPQANPAPIDPRNPNDPNRVQTPTYTPFAVTPSNDRWGKLMLRVGTVHTLQGNEDEALAMFRSVLEKLPQTGAAAEAQYRIGYVYEAVADDLDRAQDEYGRVAKMSATSPFSVQASRRLQNLERLSQFRKSTGQDSTARKAEAGFLLAELYLFQNDKPERAVEEYRGIVDSFPGTPFAGKAMNAEAWVLSRKLNRKNQADSLWWMVVYKYPKTEAQLHARDYLEAAGYQVPDSLIQPPEVPVVIDTLPPLTPVPQETDSLGVRPTVVSVDSLRNIPFLRAGEAPVSPTRAPGLGAPIDTTRAAAPSDTTRAPAPADTTKAAAPPDTLRAPAGRDTTRRDGP